jgi:hypothetical protein
VHVQRKPRGHPNRDDETHNAYRSHAYMILDVGVR